MDPLAQLRDLHVPEPISWWPPAPGWWVSGLGVIGVIWFAIWWYHRWTLLAPRRQALTELKQLRATYIVEQNAVCFMRELSILLRRYALACFPRRDVAGLAGNSWLTFLDDKGNTREFTNGAGVALAQSPYQATVQADPNEISRLVESWIKHVRRMKR